MSDYGSKYTDEQIEKIEKKIKKVYSEANKDIKKQAEEFSARFQKQDEKKRALVEKGKLSQDDYDKWKRNKVFQSKTWKTKQEHIVNILTNSNQKALDIVNNTTSDVFATNTNFAMYQIDEATQMNLSFDIYDENTVNRLILDEPELLPKPSIDFPKDERWNNNNIRNQLTQSIIQGESIDQLAKRLSNVTGKDQKFMLMQARTMMTGAQNSGRLQGYREAKKLGINVYKKWLSAHDGHTRVSHLYLDDEDPIPIEEPFEVNGQSIDYPGDPYAPPALVYNCRCTMISEIMDEDGNPLYTINEDEIDAVGLEDWIEDHVQEIVNGTDLTDSWERRYDEFDFEIEDVINAQGFDGKPRIVSSEEFDKLVKEANDGNGFVAQRTYSAETQEILQSYRDQLYNGKWYVDCSTGGAQYGQGMYCAADYTGELTDGIQKEMEHYKSIYDEKFGNKQDVKQIQEAVDVQWNKMKDRITFPHKEFDLSTGTDISLKNEKEAKEWLFDEISKMNGHTIEHEYGVKGSNWLAPSYTETMTLDKSANIVDYETVIKEKEAYITSLREPMVTEKVNIFAEENILSDLEKEVYRNLINSEYAFNGKFYDVDWPDEVDNFTWDLMKKEAQEVREAIDNSLENNNEKYKKVANMDIGSFATMRGYDAINAVGHGESGSYTVILNRTKVIIKGED